MSHESRRTFPERAANEIDGLHRLLQAWFRGDDDLAIDTIMARFDAGYRMVGAGGNILTFDQMQQVFPTLRGSRPDLIMEIENVQVEHVEGSSAIVSYLEIQRQASGTTRRWSLALLIDVPGQTTPKWKSLQETFVG